MRSITLLSMAALLAFAISCAAAANGGSSSAPSDPRMQHLYPIGSVAEYPYLENGEVAPDFSFDAMSGGPARLHDLLAQGSVLLVFGAGDAHLTALESERAVLLNMGIVPVAVLDLGSRDSRRAVARLGLHYPVIADPRRVIAAQFSCLESSTRVAAPAWFVLDRGRHVRANERFDWPSTSWASVSASALGLAMGDAVLPASASGH